MSSPVMHINGIAWVLGSGTGCSRQLPPALLDFSAAEESALENFSCKPYLQSSKGYLDAAAHYLLAACSLLRSEGEKQGQPLPAGARTGMVCLTHFGAPRSGFTFFRQMTEKGPRFASPLVFPQAYSNTAPNLAAMEFSWSGPHCVYAGPQDCRLPWQFAADRLADGSADCIVLTAYEAASAELLPPDYPVRNGAIALRLEKTASPGSLAVPPELLSGTAPEALPPPHGSVQAELLFLSRIFPAVSD
ncbi:MAG: hypothetical protein GX902_05760 [Lentisphaerae bacterium]|mgnify:CR=1 FL=1|jgi:hypothetical protein|nr:hypothetical protein [Lentisphaerota bacterium]